MISFIKKNLQCFVKELKKCSLFRSLYLVSFEPTDRLQYLTEQLKSSLETLAIKAFKRAFMETRNQLQLLPFKV